MSATTSTPRQNLTGARQERPWGHWEILDRNDGYQVKRLTVLPRSRLSLQTHRHRSEHWLVVTGTATCLVGEMQSIARQGAHVFVPRGAVHRLGNRQDTILEVIEIQLGTYLGEDDIVRLQDDHGRA
ncbi:phosphomannose isomerase type II C-terminal cupin domain [Nocardioides psychrotolerans]|uniref:phosphomannose isomerase type II C-terminal cupin domain n=1 Tax=Nocardioides psychrotolerans TaxID=1005945 RepID=UPI00313846E7|eukprot:gene37826-biopygen31491